MCCLFGFVDYASSLSVKQKSRLTRELSIAAEARGTDATGVAYNTSRGLQIYKRPLAAHRLHLRIPAEAHVVMGHTRMTTQGSAKKNYNNHPFLGCVKGKSFALAHNGVLWNDLDLRHTKHLPRTKVQTDSYIAIQLIEQQKVLNLSNLRWLLHAPLHELICQHLRAKGLQFQLPEGAIRKLLHANGLIEVSQEGSSDKGKLVFTKKASVEGRPRMLVLRTDAARSYVEHHINF